MVFCSALIYTAYIPQNQFSGPWLNLSKTGPWAEGNAPANQPEEQ